MANAKMNRALGSLDSGHIPVRVQFGPTNSPYFESLMNVHWKDEENRNSPESIGYDELGLALMQQYFVLISGGSSDVRELETAFVNRQRTADNNPGQGDLFAGLTFLEMVNRANRAELRGHNRSPLPVGYQVRGCVPRGLRGVCFGKHIRRVIR